MLVDAGQSAGPIEIPKGDPGALADASSAWARLAQDLQSSARTLRGGGKAGLSATDWTGRAAATFDGLCGIYGETLDSSAVACHTTATALRTFSHALREAQKDARRAAREWEHADGERESATAAADRETGDAQNHRAAARGARELAGRIRDRPHMNSEAQAQGHDDEARRADAQAAAAEAAARRAAARAEAAAREQRRAEKAGRKANDDADRAARHASAAFEHSSGAFADPPGLGGIPNPPVDPTAAPGTSNPFAAPKGASPFGNDFHGLRPGDVRRNQIEAKQKKLDELANRRDKGSIRDGLAGLADGLTLGLAKKKIGGDDKSGRYHGGELASFLVTVGGVTKIIPKAAKAAEAAKAGEEAEDAGKAAQKLTPKQRRRLEKKQGRKDRESREQLDKARKDVEKRGQRAKLVEKALDLGQQIIKLPVDIPSDVAANIYENWTMYRYYAPVWLRAKVEEFFARLPR